MLIIENILVVYFNSFHLVRECKYAYYAINDFLLIEIRNKVYIKYKKCNYQISVYLFTVYAESFGSAPVKCCQRVSFVSNSN